MENPSIEPSKKSWNVSLLRFTLFPFQAYEMDENWWNLIFETLPDNENYNRKVNVHHYDGEFKSGLMNLDLSPLRIDFIYISMKSNSGSKMADINLGLFNDVMGKFFSIISKFLILDNCPTAQRIAFGCNCFIPTETRISGYELLDSYLPKVEVDSVNSSDFLYQINRRRQSKIVSNLSINRLTQWHVAQYGSAIISQAHNGQQLIDLNEKEYSVNLELDINSQQDNMSELNRDTQIKLLEELIIFAEEISLNGDIL